VSIQTRAARRVQVRTLTAALCLVGFGLAPARSEAQQRSAKALFAARLDASTRAALEPLLDSARAAGLPTDPLIEKALEGASKRATGARIVAAVRALQADLGAARSALGATSSEEEIVAGASALRAGVDAASLGQLRADRPGRSLTVPLAVLTDLIVRGVPVDTAAAVVASLERGGAADGDFITLRGNVERDVHAGALPAVAASVRAHGVPASVGAPPGRALGLSHRKPKKP